MKKSAKLWIGVTAVLILVFGVLLIFIPSLGRSGVSRGLLLCGNIVIPSLFPFTFCVLFIINSGAINLLKPFSGVIGKAFKMNCYSFSVFLLSLIGGYPVGAKLLNQGVKNGSISPHNASILLNFCVNAGPAFIITAVGIGVYSSKTVGILLFVSHILSSVLIYLFLRNMLSDDNEGGKRPPIAFSDNFVLSAAESAKSVMGICAFVILFSAINSYMVALAEVVPFIKGLVLMLEITNTLALTKNIYAFSFLLGFSGFCVWFQIRSCCTHFKPILSLFALSRLLHGGLSSVITALLLKLFGISFSAAAFPPVFSFCTTPQLMAALLIMVLIFALSLSSEKYNCKLLNDVV